MRPLVALATWQVAELDHLKHQSSGMMPHDKSSREMGSNQEPGFRGAQARYTETLQKVGQPIMVFLSVQT